MASGVRLNREQRQAVADLRGAVRIVAGAGTGKTAVIAERFRRLVAQGDAPDSILVMTFTERAAAEMRSRIADGLGSYTGELWIGTFHSVAQALLREEGWRIGVPPSFRIVAGADRWILMRELLWELGDPALVGAERPDDLVNPLLRLLERTKQELVAPARLSDWARTAEDPELGEQLLAAIRLFAAYARRCSLEKLLDFDDLILQLVRLLGTRAEVRKGFVKRFTSVLVDEYQDSNLAQERMVELLGSAGNVCVVGDDDQSIYRFRGASLASMDRFAHAFPDSVTKPLGRNRRSTASIVAAAAALIAHNPIRLAKDLSAFRPAGPRVDLAHAANGLDEALQVRTEVVRLAATGIPLRRIAILTRTNALSGPLVGALRAADVPHQVWGARGFYRRPEILDVIAYLRLLLDPSDQLAIARLCARPGASLDPVAVLARLSEARLGARPPLATLEEWPAASAWVGTVRRLIGLSARLGIDDLFFELMASTAYLEVARFETEAERRQVSANLAKFSELIESFRERSRDQSLAAFMSYLELVIISEEDEVVAQAEEVEEAVQLMTIHQAKGLEFDAVFIPALVEGRLPQPHRGDRFRLPAQLAGETAAREDQIAEERRLLYVAMTRARDHLHLSWADRYEGGRIWKPSRFLDELATAGRHRFRHREVTCLALPALSGAVAHRPAEGQPAPPSGPVGAVVGVRPLAPPLSFSGISTYRECPRQYQYRYVHRLPVRSTVEAEFGNIVHSALMRIGRLRQSEAKVSPEAAGAIYEQAWDGAEFPDSRRLPAMRALGRLQIERYLASGGFASRPAMVEEAFTAELDGWRLRGIIDRVDPPPTEEAGGWVPGDDDLRLAPGGSGAAELRGPAPAEIRPWRLIDYKTGDPIPASRSRRDLQLALYALGAKRAMGIEPVELEIVYLKDASRVVIRAEQALLAEAERIGREVAVQVEAGGFEPRPERRRCSLCAYRLACPSAL